MVGPELALLFFCIAMVYAAAGFGGGSSYLAILALYELPFTVVRSTALLCNIAVVSQSTWAFSRNGLMPWRRALPLVAVSVPMAFVGGMWPLRARAFYLLLAAALALAALLMWVRLRSPTQPRLRQLPLGGSLLLGGAIGLLSGLVGIGGGIFLSPVLHLTRWDTPKRIAATSSLFILLNSTAGLAGQLMHPHFQFDAALSGWLLAAVAVGGALGTRFTIRLASPLLVRALTATLILWVAIRLLTRHL